MNSLSISQYTDPSQISFQDKDALRQRTSILLPEVCIFEYVEKQYFTLRAAVDKCFVSQLVCVVFYKYNFNVLKF